MVATCCAAGRPGRATALRSAPRTPSRPGLPELVIEGCGTMNWVPA